MCIQGKKRDRLIDRKPPHMHQLDLLGGGGLICMNNSSAAYLSLEVLDPRTDGRKGTNIFKDGLDNTIG